MEESYISLINAIILQAFKDYKYAVRTLKRKPDDEFALHLKWDVERFCRSGWLTFLTDLDGGWLMERMEIYSKGGRK